MSKLSYKSLLIIFFFLLIGVVVLAKFALPKNIVKAGWWNDSWNYRQSINISSHTTAESNVYIIASINIGATNKAQVDDGDFRFISQSGDLLSYYIVSGTGTTNITFHIQIPSFPAGASTIFAYYGSASAPNGFSSSDFATQATNYTIGSYSAEEVGGGPIAYWKFDEGVGTTVYNSVSSLHNGILQNGTSLATEDQCVSGKCLLFDGANDYVAFDVGSSYLPLPTFSICTWAKTPGLAAGMTLNGIISFTYGLNMAINSSGQFRSSIDNGSSMSYLTVTDINLYDNKWHHLCLTYDGTNGNSYIDGIFKKSVTTAWNNRYYTNSLNMGHDNNNPSVYKFNGYIDEPKIYNYALTANQIKQDYNSRGLKKGSSTNLGIKSSTTPDLNSKLVAYWKLNEGVGTTVYNSINSGVGISGVFGPGSSAPTWSDSSQCTSGKCLNFTSETYFSFPQISFNNTQPWTFSHWIKWSNTIGSQIFYAGRNTSYSGNFGISGQNLFFRDIGQTYNSFTSFSNYHNKLTHVAWVAEGTGSKNLSLYINGQFIKTLTINYGTNINFQSFGKGYVGNGYSLIGLLDEIKIYNSALTAEEIKQDYNQGSAISFNSPNQTIGGTTTSLEYCIPGDTSYCAPPIAEWNFEENTGSIVKDTSGNNNNGIFGIGDSAPTWTTGKIGSGLNFVSNQYMTMPTVSPAITGQQLTISSWLNFTVFSSVQRLFNNMGTGVQIGTNTSTQFFIHTTTSTGTDNNTPLASIPTSCRTGWHFFTFTWDTSLASNNINIYCDGNKVNSGTLINAINGTFNISTFQIGHASQSLLGKMDQIKVYNYVRTPAQIAYDYNKGAPTGWWKFDECQGSIAYNSSAIGNTGSINIGPSDTQNTLGTCQVGTSAAWTAGASGKYNGSLFLDSTDDLVYIPTTVNGTNATISFWIKNPARGTGPYLLRSNANNRTYFNLDSNNAAVSFTKGSPAVTIASYTAINPLTWNNIILKWWTDLSGITYGQAYINGQPIGIGKSFTDTTSGTYIVVSAFDNTGSQKTSGQFDDIRYYNYSLTNEQIKQLYNNGSVSFN